MSIKLFLAKRSLQLRRTIKSLSTKNNNQSETTKEVKLRSYKL